jgi:hypothetical protein
MTCCKDINNFTAVSEENKKRQIRLYEQQEAKRAHLQKYIDLHAQAGENGVKAAKQRKSRMKKVGVHLYSFCCSYQAISYVAFLYTVGQIGSLIAGRQEI